MAEHEVVYKTSATPVSVDTTIRPLDSDDVSPPELMFLRGGGNSFLSGTFKSSRPVEATLHASKCILTLSRPRAGLRGFSFWSSRANRDTEPVSPHANEGDSGTPSSPGGTRRAYGRTSAANSDADGSDIADTPPLLAYNDRSCVAQVVLDLSSIVCESSWQGPDAIDDVRGCSFEILAKPTKYFLYPNGEAVPPHAHNSSEALKLFEQATTNQTAQPSPKPQTGSRRSRTNSAGSLSAQQNPAARAATPPNNHAPTPVDIDEPNAAGNSARADAGTNTAQTAQPQTTRQRQRMVRNEQCKIRLTLCCSSPEVRDKWIAALSRCSTLRSPFVVDTGTTRFFQQKLLLFDHIGEKARAVASRKVHELRQALLFSDSNQDDRTLTIEDAVDQNITVLESFQSFHQQIMSHLATEPEREEGPDMLTLKLSLSRLARTTTIPEGVWRAILTSTFHRFSVPLPAPPPHAGAFEQVGVEGHSPSNQSAFASTPENPTDTKRAATDALASDVARCLPEKVGSAVRKLAEALVVRCRLVMAMKRLQHRASTRIISQVSEHLKVLYRVQHRQEQAKIQYVKVGKHKAKGLLKKASATGLPVTILLPDGSSKSLFCKIGLVKGSSKARTSDTGGPRRRPNVDRGGGRSGAGSSSVGEVSSARAQSRAHRRHSSEGDIRTGRPRQNVTEHDYARFERDSFLMMLPPHKGTMCLIFFDEYGDQRVFQLYRIMRSSSIRIREALRCEYTTVIDAQGNRCRLDFVFERPVDCYYFYVRVRSVILALRKKYHVMRKFTGTPDWLVEDFHDMIRNDTVLTALKEQYSMLQTRLQRAGDMAVWAASSLLCFSPDRYIFNGLLHHQPNGDPSQGACTPDDGISTSHRCVSLALRAQSTLRWLDDRSTVGVLLWQWLLWLQTHDSSSFWNPVTAIVLPTVESLSGGDVMEPMDSTRLRFRSASEPMVSTDRSSAAPTGEENTQLSVHAQPSPTSSVEPAPDVNHTKQTILSVLHHVAGLLVKRLAEVSKCRTSSSPKVRLPLPSPSAASTADVDQALGAVPTRAGVVVDIHSVARCLVLLNNASAEDLERCFDRSMHTLAVFSKSLQAYVAVHRATGGRWSAGNRIKWDVASMPASQFVELGSIATATEFDERNTHMLGVFYGGHDVTVPPLPSAAVCDDLVSRRNVWRFLVESVFSKGGMFFFEMWDADALKQLDTKFVTQVGHLRHLLPRDFGVADSHVLPTPVASESTDEHSEEVHHQLYFAAVRAVLVELGTEDPLACLRASSPSSDSSGIVTPPAHDGQGSTDEHPDGGSERTEARESCGERGATPVITLNPFLYADFLQRLVAAIQKDVEVVKAVNDTNGRKTEQLSTDSLLSILVYALCQTAPLRPHLAVAVCLEYNAILKDYYADLLPAPQSGQPVDSSLLQYANVALCSALSYVCTLETSFFVDDPGSAPPPEWRQMRNDFRVSFEEYMYPSSENSDSDFQSTNTFITQLQKRLS